MSDPAIEVFDATHHAGMEEYAKDSHERMAPLFRRNAEAASSDEEREGWLRQAACHERVATMYRAADRIMAEVEVALREETQ